MIIDEYIKLYSKELISTILWSISTEGERENVNKHEPERKEVKEDFVCRLRMAQKKRIFDSFTM